VVVADGNEEEEGEEKERGGAVNGRSHQEIEMQSTRNVCRSVVVVVVVVVVVLLILFVQ